VMHRRPGARRVLVRDEEQGHPPRGPRDSIDFPWRCEATASNPTPTNRRIQPMPAAREREQQVAATMVRASSGESGARSHRQRAQQRSLVMHRPGARRVLVCDEEQRHPPRRPRDATGWQVRIARRAAESVMSVLEQLLKPEDTNARRRSSE
jgi:hypothetical protein